MSALVIRSDARCLPLPDASVDLIVTSPPYFGLRSYTDGGEHYAGQVGDEATPAEFLGALWGCTREWLRVLKPSGSLWVNLGDKYSGGNNTRRGTHDGAASEPAMARNGSVAGMRPKTLIGLPWRYALGCIDQLGLILRAEVIWSKPNGLPESVTDRVRRSHEQWFHFTKEPRYFSAVDEVREEHKYPDDLRHLRGGRRSINPDGSDAGGNTSTCNPLGKLPGSVWTVPTEPLRVPDSLGVDHFAAFPTEWPRRIILGWSPPGGVVADPFGGTGTTALVASALGRIGISVDLSHDYSRLARWRTTDPGERAKALRVDKPPAQIDGQGELFEEVAS